MGLEAPAQWQRIRHQLAICAATDFDAHRRAAAELTAPVTIIHTADDPYIELELAREVAQTTPNAALHELPRGGHYPQRAAQEELAELLQPVFR